MKVKPGSVDLGSLLAAIQNNPELKVSPQLAEALEQHKALMKPKHVAPTPPTTTRPTSQTPTPSAPPPAPTPQGQVVDSHTVPIQRQPKAPRTTATRGIVPADQLNKLPAKPEPTLAQHLLQHGVDPKTSGRRVKVARGFLKGFLGNKLYGMAQQAYAHDIADDPKGQIASVKKSVDRVEKKVDAIGKLTVADKMKKGFFRGALGRAHKLFSDINTPHKAKDQPTIERVNTAATPAADVSRVPMANVPKAAAQASAEIHEEFSADQLKAAGEQDTVTKEAKQKDLDTRLQHIQDDLDKIKRKGSGGSMMMGILAMVGKVWNWLKNKLWSKLVKLAEWLGSKVWGALRGIWQAVKNIKIPGGVGGAIKSALAAAGSALVNIGAGVAFDAGEKEMNRSAHTRKMTPLFEKYGMKEIGNGKWEIDGKKYKRIGEPGDEDDLPPVLDSLIDATLLQPGGGVQKRAADYVAKHKNELDDLAAAHKQYLSDNPEEAKGQAKILADKKREDSKTFGSDVKSDINYLGDKVGIKPFDDDARYTDPDQMSDKENPFGDDNDMGEDFDMDKMSVAQIAGLTKPDSSLPSKLSGATAANNDMKEDAAMQTIVVQAPRAPAQQQAAPIQIPQKPSNPVIINTRNPESTISRMNSLLFDDPSGYTSLYRN